jgi:hypothetical protein
MRALAEDGRHWFKSSRSSVAGHCVEIAVTDTSIAMRDSKDVTGPVLQFAKQDFLAFVTGVKAAEFDL